MPEDLPVSRTCTTCHEAKPLTDFYRSKAFSIGYRSVCKVCCLAEEKRRAALAPAVETKTCNRCSECKPASEFYRNCVKTDGLHGSCKICYKAYLARLEDKWKAEPVDLPSGKNCTTCKTWKAYSEFSPVPSRKDGHSGFCKTCTSERTAKYIKKKLQSDAAEWRGSVNEKLKARRKNDPEKHRILQLICSHNRSKRRKIGGKFTQKEWLDLCRYYGEICLCCREKKPLTVDHVIPLSLGGSNTIENLQPLCLQCNKEKHAKTIDYRK